LQLLASGEVIDLVFTDVVMPGEIDGLALSQRIKKEYPDIAIVLTSGYAKPGYPPEDGLPILRKPHRLLTLARAIRAALDAQPAAFCRRC
jgi:CheY-like chemotaxis protein